MRRWFALRAAELRDGWTCCSPRHARARPAPWAPRWIAIGGQRLPPPQPRRADPAISCIGLPVCAVPVWSAEPLPIGVQVIAAPWARDHALRVARGAGTSGRGVPRLSPPAMIRTRDQPPRRAAGCKPCSTATRTPSCTTRSRCWTAVLGLAHHRALRRHREPPRLRRHPGLPRRPLSPRACAHAAKHRAHHLWARLRHPRPSSCARAQRPMADKAKPGCAFGLRASWRPM